MCHMENLSSVMETTGKCPAVDREHDLITKTITGLHNAVIDGRGREVIVPLLDLLARFCAEHFAGEEAAMKACGYPGLAAHAAAHERLLRRLLILREYAKDDAAPTIVDTMELLGWMAEHTDRYDRMASLSIQEAVAAARMETAAAGAV